MKMSQPSSQLLSEFAKLHATFPIRLWATALIVACLVTGFLGTTSEPELTFTQDEFAPAMQASADPAH
jgi:hypothetical protein